MRRRDADRRINLWLFLAQAFTTSRRFRRLAGRRLAAPAVLGGLALLPLSAHADLLDQYLPPAVPGTDNAPGVTVLSRRRPQYDPLGVHAGSFVIRTGVSQAIGFDTNPSGARSAQGSAVTDTQASVAATSDWSRHQVGTALTIDATRFLSHHEDDLTDWTAQIGGRLDIGRDALTVTYTHAGLDENPRGLDNPQLNRAIPFDQDEVRLSYQYNINRVSLTPELDYTRYRYSHATQTIPDQSYRDRDVYQPTLTGRYMLSSATNIVVLGRSTTILYQRGQNGQPRRDSDGFSFLAGFEFDTGIWQSRLLVGYQQRDYRNALYTSISSPIVEASVAWTPHGNATYTATLSRRIADSAEEAISGYTLTGAGLRVDYELRRNVLLKATAGFEQADYVQNGGTTTRTLAGLGATWLMNRSARLTGTFDFIDNHATRNVSYQDGTFLLRLGFAL